MDERPTPSERPDDAGVREAALESREKAVEAKESAQAGREEETRAILEAADARDAQADKRDAVADERDKAASLQSFLRDVDFAPAHQARLSAGMDRSDSKGDRTSAADDRFKLAQDDPEPPEPDEA
ncbi:hypothetical protein E1263_07215 [Kribbella antibiotica]|uniref:Uncharacterized protein n=1 Tax=Kribbella antibiotica TaxID=190195 RepID=A0A4R4ZT72_9ACTN|nr:hypothetical protein [Kribbella antibiotica]TDD61486.1 hypothetical protein E1263_07215 [Kribbella antibiotica]